MRRKQNRLATMLVAEVLIKEKQNRKIGLKKIQWESKALL